MELTRWHAPTCDAPDVSVDDEFPICLTCGCSCDWIALLAKSKARNATVSALGAIPRNEPTGKMNLWWPTSVPYSTSTLEDCTTDEPMPSSLASGRVNLEEEPGSCSVAQETLEEPSHSNQYANANPFFVPVKWDVLTPNQFRLVCVTPVGNPGLPVHVSLETYFHNNCPEYETVSYTWGGENGDSDRSRPIYVGAFWDIILQTENCWEMLRFVRPLRGIRMVWIDALCIDQSNAKERGEQVSNMGDIYRNSLRTIAYLGADIVLPLLDRYPYRMDFEKLLEREVRPRVSDSHPSHDSADLLKYILSRRYFSRVWVIQELILSRQTIFRIGDVEFTTNASTWKTRNATGQGLQRYLTPAPWVQYMGQQSFSVFDMFDMIGLTSKSQATDLRDRLFGVLSLLDEHTQSSVFIPNYSLSTVHVFLGFFAHCLVNLERTHLFHHAAGLSSSPTWLPNWETQGSWEKIFSQWPLQFSAPHLYGLHAEQSTLKYSEFPSSPVLRYENKHSHRRWNQDAVIDRNTGAMTLFLIKFCTLPARPEPVQYDVFGTRYFTFLGSNSALCLVSATDLGAETIQPRRDFIFIVSDKDSTCLVLREQPSSGPIMQYKLITTLSRLYIGATQRRAFGGYSGLDLSDLQQSVFEHVTKTRLSLDQYIYATPEGYPLCRYFPGTERLSILYPLFRALETSDSDDSDHYTNACVLAMRQIMPHADIQIQNCYIRYSLSARDWEAQLPYDWPLDHREKPPQLSHIYHHNVEPGLLGGCRWLGDRGQWLDEGKWTNLLEQDIEGKCSLTLQQKGHIEIRLPLDGLPKAFRFLPALERIRSNIQMIGKVMKMNHDEVIALLYSVPEDDLKLIGCPLAFGGLKEDFGVDGSTVQVQIV